MAVSGWYPDPGGSPGRYRYWDGTQWSAQTTTDPGSPPPNAQPARPGRKGTSRWPWLVAAVLVVAIVAVIVAVIVALVFRGWQSQVLTDPNPPAPSISGWNDSSPLQTASATPTPTPTPSPPPATTSQNPVGKVACAQGDPYDVQPHPADGRIHGGSLSIVQPGGDWRRDDDYARAMTWAYDVAGADEWVEPAWLAMVAVGSVHADDGFENPKQAANGILQCVASSSYYEYFTGETTEFSKPYSLQGRSGWAIRAQVRVDDPQVKASGDVVEIIVLDTGTDGELSFFAGFVPIGDQNRLKLLDTTIAGMQVA